MDPDILQLEESLQILEELIYCNPNDRKLITLYIQRLKQFYSPEFDFEHSESGSYYYAAIKCISLKYIENKLTSHISLPQRFQDSLSLLLEINMCNFDTRNNNTSAVDKLISLASLWELNTTLDIPDLMIEVLREMRLEILHSNLQY
ncbi:MAG: hypothetical protein AAGB35_01390 [Pseudomonadota bacterium]